MYTADLEKCKFSKVWIPAIMYPWLDVLLLPHTEKVSNMNTVLQFAEFTNHYLVFQQAAAYLAVAYFLFRKWEDSRPDQGHRSRR